ncbi:MAG TPA: ligase-associated DNA damage response endonuclease PdeM [Saprospiraceae bacterium]|nr:ligase-associated DNA damage response endonuclease PdeM [Saprospiraceae bacterium]
MNIRVAGEELELHPYKSVYWQRRRALWIADLHLGKASHFNRAGIAVPEAVTDANWEHLYELLDRYHPRDVLFLGDLFHSQYNIEWDILGRFLRTFPGTRFHLIMGNHDILDDKHYQDLGLLLHEPYLEWAPFLFSHHPLEEVPEDWYPVCGHIHPAVRLRGQAYQGLRVPCFYFGETQAILPAFGAFTGTGVIHPRRGDRIFMVADDEIIPAGAAE